MKNILLICFLLLFLNACSSSSNNLNNSEKVLIKSSDEEYDDFDKIEKENDRLLNSDNGLLKLKNSCLIYR